MRIEIDLVRDTVKYFKKDKRREVNPKRNMFMIKRGAVAKPRF